MEQIIKRGGAWQRKLMLDFCCCKIWDSEQGNKVIYFQMRIPKNQWEIWIQNERNNLKRKKGLCLHYVIWHGIKWILGQQAIQCGFSCWCCWSKDSPAPARSSWQIVEQENPYLERGNLFHPRIFFGTLSLFKNKSSEAYILTYPYELVERLFRVKFFWQTNGCEKLILGQDKIKIVSW